MSTPQPNPRDRAAERVRRARAFAEQAAERPLAADMLERAREVDLVTRAMGLASRVFVAIIPLTIVIQAVTPLFGSESLGKGLIDRFGVEGDAADSLLLLFPSPDAVRSGTTTASIFILLISALTLSRAFQQLFEKTFLVAPRGLRSIWRGLVWVLLFLGLLGVRSAIQRLFGSSLAGVVAGAAAVVPIATAFWMASGRLLLGSAVTWARMTVPAAACALTSAAVTLGLHFYGPRLLSENTERFGVIGAVFSLLSLILVSVYALCFALVLGAALGDHLAARRAAAGAPSVR